MVTGRKEHPIVFSLPMVRAILEGRKTKTRRIVEPTPRAGLDTSAFYFSPYGIPGDRMWARETTESYPTPNTICGRYRADKELVRDADQVGVAWWYSKPVCPAIHMPRWASRIILEIADVRVERLQDISAEDALAEGSFLERCPCMPRQRDRGVMNFFKPHECAIHGTEFSRLWNSLHGEGAWEANPYVWVIAFEKE